MAEPEPTAASLMDKIYSHHSSSSSDSDNDKKAKHTAAIKTTQTSDLTVVVESLENLNNPVQTLLQKRR
ncbi:hypothetical protein ACFX13_042667 [Malus domestica]